MQAGTHRAGVPRAPADRALPRAACRAPRSRGRAYGRAESSRTPAAARARGREDRAAARPPERPCPRTRRPRRRAGRSRRPPAAPVTSWCSADEDRPAKEVADPAEVALPVKPPACAELLCLRVARVCAEPLVERLPVQRLVAVPVV